MRLPIILTIAALFNTSELVAQAPLRLLSFNIRYGTARDADHVWPNRRQHVITTIRDHAPHILGVQEALRFQLDELGAALPMYREIGVGRDDGMTRGEYAAILVDTSRFVVVTHGQFWFSDTPSVPNSMHWGNRITRLCTWMRLVDRANGDTLAVFNQHWDHESQPSRERSARLLLDTILRISPAGEPKIVMGDFNSGEQNPAFQTLLADTRLQFVDSFRAMFPTASVVGTFNAFKGDSTGDKIDAILVTRDLRVLDASIDRRRFGNLWASDHFAVSAIVRRAGEERPIPCTARNTPPGCR